MSRTLLALEKFLTLTETMSSAAKAQEWDALARMGEERSTLLQSLPTDLGANLSTTEQVLARTIVERCKRLDAQTCSLAEERQKAIGSLLRGLMPLH